MYFSKTTEYVLRISIYLHENNKSLVSAKRMSEELSIPYKYIGHILTMMSNKNLLNVTRGKFGGYKLAVGVSNFSVSQVVERFEDKSRNHRCLLGETHCSEINPCTMYKQWATVLTTMEIKLGKLRVCDLAETSFIKAY